MADKKLQPRTTEELQKELLELRREQFNLRVQQSTGQLARNHEHKRVRKDIARIKTLLNRK